MDLMKKNQKDICINIIFQELEVLGSNGSTSQASVCGSSLALMDAGVPIKKPVAGISTGLFTNEDGKNTMVTDIQGLEDFFRRNGL